MGGTRAKGRAVQPKKVCLYGSMDEIAKRGQFAGRVGVKAARMKASKELRKADRKNQV